MTKKIFFDANILIDLTNAGNELYEETLFLFDHFVRNRDQLYCSPTSFAITYFFLNKTINNIQKLNKTAIDFFSTFTFTREDNIIMKKVIQSDFTDLEDALQYYSAEDCGVNIIITKNFFDFKKSSIPVYHPLQYLNEFLL
ncbi:MAG TPA: type II toxin-antitoxin system VapC family toxin [Hanamia sp.]|nr:type II toxin-antitoxin system VapC family toxin [Hanamia sp.]